VGARLQGKVAVVTGAAMGIGAEIARVFAGEGARVAIADIADGPGNAVARETGALYAHADVSDSREVDALFTTVAEELGGPDVLVNNAICTLNDTTIADLDEAVWDRTIAVCLKGPFLCTRRALPLMRARGGGSIVTLSSVNALFGVSETAYTAAKGGLISMMRLVAAEYGEWNIRSNLICPGTIETENCMEYWRRIPESFARLRAMYPLGRIGQPREVAQLAAFLASDEASFITGSVQVIDGGLLAGRKFEV
jgi:NAD(P)-dependent dehydrogenase (short-subunit alcohol dehydrogenase family)